MRGPHDRKRDQTSPYLRLVALYACQPPVALECKWRAAHADLRGMAAFRRQYPEGRNLLVAHDVDRRHTRTCNGLEIIHCPIGQIADMAT